MNNFDRLNFKVCPIQDPVNFKKRPNYNGHLLRWGEEDCWCDWEERDDIYPNTLDWYVLPGGKTQYFEDGMEWGYYILDIDRGHAAPGTPEAKAEEERYNWSIHVLKDIWKIPPSLMIKTASGGLHIYYKAPAEFLPRQCTAVVDDKPTSIEVKVNTGWVAPNGRDRLIIRDLPVAIYYPKGDDPFGEAVKLKAKKFSAKEYIEDPSFDISTFPIPDVTEGNRHSVLLTSALSLRALGCPYDAYYEWATEFFEKNGRTPQQKEIENAWEDNRKEIRPTIIERNMTDLKELLEPDPLEGAEELTGLEMLEAQAVFSTEEEKVELRKQYLEILNDNKSH